jgi:hypothetical protein
MLISTALLLDSIIRNSVCTPAKLPCRRVEVGYELLFIELYVAWQLREGTQFSHKGIIRSRSIGQFD